MEHVHVYNTRTAWALLKIDQVARGDKYRFGARRNLDWVLNQQTSDGWFHNASFEGHEPPLTHTLAYTIEGLLEAGKLLANNRLIVAARLTADALKDRQDGYLRGNYQSGWQTKATWSCLTGNAQMAIVWLNLYKITDDISYLQAATAANEFLKRVQSCTSNSPGVRGGIPGSYPIYGDYGHYLFLNWAAKFFADSLMLEEKIMGSRA
jgi:uncharacterized protein YyaL (SSP411 family)